MQIFFVKDRIIFVITYIQWIWRAIMARTKNCKTFLAAYDQKEFCP